MNIYDFKAKKITGEEISLEKYKGKVLMIVNTATHCGFTKQYNELEYLYKKYKKFGFEILDFPCNQFKNQAPESNSKIKSMCSVNFGVTFDQFEKIDVNGENEFPLYTYLKNKKSGFLTCILGSKIKWNFTKFLIDRNGNVIKRYSPTTNPKKLETKIKELLECTL